MRGFFVPDNVCFGNSRLGNREDYLERVKGFEPLTPTLAIFLSIFFINKKNML